MGVSELLVNLQAKNNVQALKMQTSQAHKQKMAKGRAKGKLAAADYFRRQGFGG